jgi:hypothetical protein
MSHRRLLRYGAQRWTVAFLVRRLGAGFGFLWPLDLLQSLLSRTCVVSRLTHIRETFAKVW